MPLISVLMPVLNEERGVVKAVTSVLDQLDVDVEVLVVDGRSTDRTAELVEELQHSDPRVRLLINPRTIIPAGLNIALEHSRGDYVARVDGHGEISADYLKRALDWLTSSPRMAVVGGRRIGVAHTRVGRAVALVMGSPFGVGNSINHFADEPQLTDHASFGVSRSSVARDVGGWDETLLVNEDVDYDHRVQLAGHDIGYDPQMMIWWQVRETLPDLFRQYRRYGRGKGTMLRKNGLRAMRLRHAVPPLAVVGGSAVLLLSLWHPASLLAAVPYAALVVGASIQTWRDRPDPAADVSWGALPLAFVATHAAWGIGLLEGLVLKRQPRRASGATTVRAAKLVLRPDQRRSARHGSQAR